MNNYTLTYEDQRVTYGDNGHPRLVIDPSVEFYKYSGCANASAYGLSTYNPFSASITIESYDLYYPVTENLSQVDTVRVFIGGYDIDDKIISCQSLGQAVELSKVDNPSDALPASITVDGTTFIRHHFTPTSSTEVAVPMGWACQVFFAHNEDTIDPWDDEKNAIFPLCANTTGVASSDGTNTYNGIAALSSTINDVRNTLGSTYKCNYNETITYVSSPAVWPNTENRWCIPTAENTGIQSRFNIFPYIHMNGLRL